jgi:hypothetical protein
MPEGGTLTTANFSVVNKPLGADVPIKHLVNGRSIVQVPVDDVAYYRVELPRHDVVLAEGLPVESYLDTGDRANFANCGAAVRLHPDFATRSWEAFGCAPLVVTGPQLAAVRRRLNRRATRRTASTLRGRQQQAFDEGNLGHFRMAVGCDHGADLGIAEYTNAGLALMRVAMLPFDRRIMRRCPGEDAFRPLGVYHRLRRSPRAARLASARVMSAIDPIRSSGTKRIPRPQHGLMVPSACTVVVLNMSGHRPRSATFPA